MKCWKCGKEAADGSKFCGFCGADLTQAATGDAPQAPVPPAPQAPQAPVPPAPEPPVSGGTNLGGGDIILKVFAGICVAIYAVMVVGKLWDVLRGVAGIFTAISYPGALLSSVVFLVVNVLTLLVYVWMLAMLLLLILKRTPENSDGILTLVIAGVVAVAAVKLVTLVVGALCGAVFHYHFMVMDCLKDLLLCVLGAAVAAGGTYAILRLVGGENPLAGKDFNTLMEEGRVVLQNLSKRADAAAQGAKASWDAQRQAQATQAQAAQAQQQAQATQYPAGAYQPPQNQAPVNYGMARHMKTNRGLLVYILLNIVTCGIYGWYFIYALARDLNVVCEGDGKRTGGLLKFILLNFITCNIYSWIWYYGVGNRLAGNAPRYGLNFQENGTTILLWMLVGMLLCGIGPLVALHIICKNTNTLCGAYNVRCGV